MKKLLIILNLILIASLTQSAFAVKKIYLQEPSPYYNNYYSNPYSPYGAYNRYNNYYYSPYRYRRTNYSDAKRIQRINRIRRLNRMRNNFLTWNFNNNNNNGVLSGYSLPINKSAYNQVGLEDFDKEYNKISPKCNTDLFSAPSKNTSYYSNGNIGNDSWGVGSKTGVQIIYD